MSEVGKIEREYGVPIPGRILPPERWARTALKRLPTGPIDWFGIFGRRAPLVVDLGCGNGRYLLGSALARPDFDHVGIDILPLVLRYATRRANQRGLSNLRLAAVDGQRFVHEYLGDGSVREMHCYHPQPFHDAHLADRRMLTPRFFAETLRVLEPGGKLFLQTDNAGYWNYLGGILPSFFDWHDQPTPWPDTPKGRTRREILARRRGLPIHRGWGVALPLSREETLARAESLPPPIFDAGERHRDLDDEERE
jgi:tRNA (guanine-N7-)-methyltransferase